MASTEL
jgi:hypothetical protein